MLEHVDLLATDDVCNSRTDQSLSHSAEPHVHRFKLRLCMGTQFLPSDLEINRATESFGAQFIISQRGRHLRWRNIQSDHNWQGLVPQVLVAKQTILLKRRK
jgi:hypothetical protein